MEGIDSGKEGKHIIALHHFHSFVHNISSAKFSNRKLTRGQHNKTTLQQQCFSEGNISKIKYLIIRKIFM